MQLEATMPEREYSGGLSFPTILKMQDGSNIAYFEGVKLVASGELPPAYPATFDTPTNGGDDAN